MTTTITDRERNRMVNEVDKEMEKIERERSDRIQQIEIEFRESYRKLLERKVAIYDLWAKGQVQ